MHLNLPAHFANNSAGCFAYRVHAERREDEWKQSAEEQADDHLWIGKRKLEYKWLTVTCDVHCEFLHVRPKQNERCEASRSNGVAFGHCLHRVAHRVELIGDIAYFTGQLAHYSDTASIVGNRTERIERDDDSCHGQHRHDGDRDSVKAAKMKAQQNCNCNEAYWQRGGMLTNCQTGDD